MPCELLRLEFLSFSFVKQSFTSNTTVLVCYLHPFIYIYIYTHMRIRYLYVSRYIVFLEKPNPFSLLYFRCFSNIFPLGCDIIKKTWLVESKVIPAYTVKTTVLGDPHKFSSLAKKIGFASITGIIP